MPHKRAPEPWKSFLADIDDTLYQPVVLNCIGGFALAMLYDLPRPTVDVDCLSVVPVEETAPLQSLAGEGSALHKKHGVYLQHVGIVTVPENYIKGCRNAAGRCVRTQQSECAKPRALTFPYVTA